MSSLLQQLKDRRLALGLKQNDMQLRIGVSRQQYQRLESKGNPRLDTLELIAKGLNSDILLVPKEQLAAVLAVLENEVQEAIDSKASKISEQKRLADDPWQDLLEPDA